MTLTWTEEFDDDDNSIWKAASLYHDDGDPFMFVLVQALRNNRIEWLDASDAECGSPGDTWLTLNEAKAACQQSNNVIAHEIQNAN